MKNNKQYLIEIFVTVCVASLIGVMYLAGYNYGFGRGSLAGYVIAIDTVDSVIATHIDADNVTKLVLVGESDTNTYFISNKILTK